MRKRTVVTWISLLALAGLLAAPAWAEEPGGGLSGLSAVSADALSKANGKEGVSLNVADLESTHSYNQANGARTGNASIGANALSDVNGVAAVVVNSGNNAVVQVSQQVIFNLH